MPLYNSLKFLILLLVSSSSVLAFRYSFLFLKWLLFKHLRLYRLCTFPWFGSFNICVLFCFFDLKYPDPSSSNHSICCFNSYRPRLSLAEVLIFCIMYTVTLFMSFWPHKFSKAAKLFGVLTWCCFLTSNSRSFLRLNINIHSWCKRLGSHSAF